MCKRRTKNKKLEIDNELRLKLKPRPWKEYQKNKISTVQYILKRDVNNCWLCGNPLKEDITWEHLIPKSYSGMDHPNNLVLCHEKCNHALGTRPYQEKIELKESIRNGNLIIRGKRIIEPKTNMEF